MKWKSLQHPEAPEHPFYWCSIQTTFAFSRLLLCDGSGSWGYGIETAERVFETLTQSHTWQENTSFQALTQQLEQTALHAAKEVQRERESEDPNFFDDTIFGALLLQQVHNTLYIARAGMHEVTLLRANKIIHRTHTPILGERLIRELGDDTITSNNPTFFVYAGPLLGKDLKATDCLHVEEPWTLQDGDELIISSFRYRNREQQTSERPTQAASHDYLNKYSDFIDPLWHLKCIPADSVNQQQHNLEDILF